MEHHPGNDAGKVIPLGVEPIPEPPPEVSRPRRVHALAMIGVVVSALITAGAALIFITVRWPGDSGRTVIAVMLFAILGLVTCTAIAVMAAARDTYAAAPGALGSEAPSSSEPS